MPWTDSYDRPLVALAPMAGITDLPTRQLVARFGVDFVVSEMVASQEMVQAKPGVREKAELGLTEARTVVQIAGREGHWMAEAARRIEAQGAALIDINMGCPAKKVTQGLSGSALMRDLDHAVSLIEAVVGAVAIPVTVKMRLGWDDDMLNAPELARRAENAGVQGLTVHGRTRCQFYTGVADWVAIARVIEAVTIPVIANGDIVDASTAQTALSQSGGQGVMIGRGAQGRPWLPAQVRAAVAGQPVPAAPTDLGALASEHYDALLSFYGTTLGGRVSRKHLGWYMDTAGTPPEMRRRVLTAPPSEVIALLPDALTLSVAA